MLLVEIASWLLIAVGGGFCVIGAVGMLRMPDCFTRMHAASLIDTLGAALLLAGLMLQAGWSLTMLKIGMLGLLIFFASPTATHALAKAALASGLQPQLARPEPPAAGRAEPERPETGDSGKRVRQ